MPERVWLYCPICNRKTRIQLRTDTILENFPLFCPKCKHETEFYHGYRLIFIILYLLDVPKNIRCLTENCALRFCTAADVHVRLYRLLCHQPVRYVNLTDAVVRYHRAVVHGKKILGVVIANGIQRSKLALQRFAISIPYGICNLVIAFPFFVNGDKINFGGACFADIDFIISAQQLQIDDVFQYVTFVRPFTSENAVAQADIRRIVFAAGFQILFSFDIVAVCSVKDKAFDQGSHVVSTVWIVIFRPAEVKVSAIFFVEHRLPILSNRKRATLLSISGS